MGKDKSAKKFGKASRYDSYLDVEKYWKEYYEIVGEQGDDLQTLIAQAKKFMN